MIPRKLVETFFRRLWLLALPVLVVPVLATFLAEFPVEYRSSVRVWVSPLEGVGADRRPTSTTKTAAETQVEVLSDLLATDVFRTDVAVAANLIPANADEGAQAAARAKVEQAVSIAPLGPHLFGLSATSEAPAEAQAIAAAVISRYQERIRAEAERQSAAVVDYYRTQVAVANGDLDRIQAELDAHLVAFPIAGDPLQLDTERLRLQRRVEDQRNLVEELSAALREAERVAVAAPNSQLAAFNVEDPPRLPREPEPVPLTKRALYPAAGLMLGLFLSTAYLYFSYRTDHSIRSREDLAGLPVPLLGYVPELKPARRRPLGRFLRKERPVATRHHPEVTARITSVSEHQGGAS